MYAQKNDTGVGPWLEHGLEDVLHVLFLGLRLAWHQQPEELAKVQVVLPSADVQQQALGVDHVHLRLSALEIATQMVLDPSGVNDVEAGQGEDAVHGIAHHVHPQEHLLADGLGEEEFVDLFLVVGAG